MRSVGWVLPEQMDFEVIFAREGLDLIYISSYPFPSHPVFGNPTLRCKGA